MTTIRAEAGFSLIEALAALAIMALIVAVATPNLGRALDAIEFRAKTGSYVQEIELLRTRAFIDQRKIAFPQDGSTTAATDIIDEGMEGWKIAGDQLIFLKTGICTGGELTLIAPSGRSATYAFDAPECEAKRL